MSIITGIVLGLIGFVILWLILYLIAGGGLHPRN
jgi:hypothetical protein